VSVPHSEIVPLDLGSFHRPASETATGVARTDAVLAYLVRHPDALMLFDTGFGAIDPEIEAHYRPSRRSLEDALREHGVQLGDIGLVINCHLHVDHIGGNPALAGTPIVTQSIELAEARSTPYAGGLIDFAGAVYRELDGDAELFPGIRVIATPGHTAGHQSLVVATAQGVVVLAGQAREQAVEFAADPEAAILATDPVRVVFAHDRAVWEPGGTS
jgi:glyoxylase-like metal-dependent hydrolase (beta-lactamase superfamily II)